jgi:hypothetical protein
MTRMLMTSMLFLKQISSFHVQHSARTRMYINKSQTNVRGSHPYENLIQSHSIIRLKASVDNSGGSSATKSDGDYGFDLPWGERQKWALRDNIQKFIVEIPQLGGADKDNSRYAMWKALTKESIELSGYDVKFLQQKYEEDEELEGDAPGILPQLDGFEFKSNGGVAGQIRGLKGIADGTTIQTSPLAHVQLTIPRGYVLTEDGSSAYELGEPLSEENYKLDIAGIARNGRIPSVDVNGVAQSLKSGVESSAGSLVDAVSDKETTNMLVNLGATTGIVLGGALAVNLLSHHLTLNVFWV